MHKKEISYYVKSMACMLIVFCFLASVSYADIIETEDFEAGNLTEFPWETGGDGVWAVQGSVKHSGSYAVKSPVMGATANSYLRITRKVTVGSNISFWYKVSTQSVLNALKFKIDGVEQNPYGGWWGAQDWTLVQFQVSPGVHTFEWVFVKQHNYESDTAYVDNISFPYTGLPYILTNPTYREFGNVYIGASSSQSFTVSNSSFASGDLTLYTLSTPCDSFALQNDNCSGHTLAPSESCTVSVVFSPEGAGDYWCYFTIPSNDPYAQPLEVPMLGTGITCNNAPIRVSGSPYSSLQAAYAAVSNGGTIQTQAVLITESFNANTSNKAVTLEGGYDCNYSSNSGGMTSIKGQLNVSAGTLTMKNIILKQ